MKFKELLFGHLPKIVCFDPHIPNHSFGTKRLVDKMKQGKNS